MMEFRAGMQPWLGDDVAVLLCQRDHVRNRIMYVAKPVQWTMEQHDQDSLVLDPTFRLTRDEARGLMDALWQAGVRPTEFKNPSGEINRMEAHLADMRKLVFEHRKDAEKEG